MSRVRRVPTLLLTVVIISGCGSGSGTGDADHSGAYSPQEMALLSEVEPVVNEYFHLRKRGMLSGEVEALWTRFPALRNVGPPGSGINAEGPRVAAWSGTRLIDGDVLMEADRRFPVDAGADTVALHMRGREMYLRPDFRHSAWTLEMTLVLRRAGGEWEVVRSDELTEMERHTGRE